MSDMLELLIFHAHMFHDCVKYIHDEWIICVNSCAVNCVISSLIYKIDFIVWYDFICFVLYAYMFHALIGLLKSEMIFKIDQLLSQK